MHLTSDYTLVLEVFSAPHAELLHTYTPSLERCVEDAWFSGICTRQLPLSCTAAAAMLRPLWRQQHASDTSLHGFAIDIVCQCNGQQHTFAKWYAPTSLRLQMQAALQACDSDRALALETLHCRLCAVPKPPEPDTPRRLHTVTDVLPLPARPRSLAALLQDSTQVTVVATTLFPVLVAQATVRDITTATLHSIGAEQAGMLVGQLCYDPEQRLLFLHVTAQILAETQAERQAAAFHFQPETFLRAQRQLDQRGQDDLIVGWWHSHAWCRACLDTTDCSVDTLFFSPQDFHVHHAAFAQPYMVAMVAGKAANTPMRTPVVKMFGWQDGTVGPRPFHCLSPGQ